jgi:hypothetical protein
MRVPGHKPHLSELPGLVKSAGAYALPTVHRARRMFSVVLFSFLSIMRVPHAPQKDMLT